MTPDPDFALNCAAVHEELFARNGELPLSSFSDRELAEYLAWLDAEGKHSSAAVIRAELDTLGRELAR